MRSLNCQDGKIKIEDMLSVIVGDTFRLRSFFLWMMVLHVSYLTKPYHLNGFTGSEQQVLRKRSFRVLKSTVLTLLRHWRVIAVHTSCSNTVSLVKVWKMTVTKMNSNLSDDSLRTLLCSFWRTKISEPWSARASFYERRKRNLIKYLFKDYKNVEKPERNHSFDNYAWQDLNLVFHELNLKGVLLRSPFRSSNIDSFLKFWFI